MDGLIVTDDLLDRAAQILRRRLERMLVITVPEDDQAHWEPRDPEAWAEVGLDPHPHLAEVTPDRRGG